MKVQVILGSTRPGRATERVAKWVAQGFIGAEGVEVELVDLADYPLAFFDEAVSPRYNPDRQPDEATQKFLDKIAEGDAYVWVTPEYNHAPAGVLKNAIDYLTYELQKKPNVFVGHGSVGGARAIVVLKEIVSEAQGVVLPAHVSFVGWAAQHLDEEGNYINEATKGENTAKLQSLVAELTWFGNALKAARA